MIPFVIAAVLAGATPDSLAAPIVTAENHFAADAQRLGVRLAFLAHFDADSWLFRPYPVSAHNALARDAEDGSPLEWGPDIVGVASSGDMGFTSGPWSGHAAGTDGFVHGHFLSIWKRGDDGVWRVQVDNGISHPALKAPSGEVKTVAVWEKPEAPLAADALARRRKAFESADDALRDALAKGDANAWRNVADPEWRVMRSKEMPATGEETFALVAKDPARRGSGPRKAFDVASSGDLAWSIGGDASCKECGTYYRIWRWRDDRWRLLVDLTKP